MRNDIRLIALDLDGTLLTSDKRLTNENKEALQRAAEAGCEIVPATGRFFEGMPTVIRRLPFVHYAITINGAHVVELESGNTIYRSELPLTLARSVMEYLDKLPVIYDCYMDNWGWMTQSCYDQAEDYACSPQNLDMIRKLRTPVPELKAYITEKQRDIQKIQLFTRDPALRARVMEELRTLFPETAVTTSMPNNLEINSRHAGKGEALCALAKYLKLDMTQTMAFGDDLNDVGMLLAAGIGIAMANASPEIRGAADYVTSTCDHNGVAMAIRRFVL